MMCCQGLQQLPLHPERQVPPGGCQKHSLFFESHLSCTLESQRIFLVLIALTVIQLVALLPALIMNLKNRGSRHLNQQAIQRSRDLAPQLNNSFRSLTSYGELAPDPGTPYPHLTVTAGGQPWRERALEQSHVRSARC